MLYNLKGVISKDVQPITYRSEGLSRPIGEGVGKNTIQGTYLPFKFGDPFK